MNIETKKYNLFIPLLLSVCLYFIGLVSGMNNILWSAVIVLFFASCKMAGHFKEKGILYILFLISFFVFLLGRNTLYVIVGFRWAYIYDKDYGVLICSSLFLSLITIYFVFYYFQSNSIVSKKNFYEAYPEKTERIFRLTKKLFLLTIPFVLLVNLERGIYGLTHVYASESYHSVMPFAFKKIAQMNPMFFYIILGTFPSKRKLFPLAALFVLGSMLTLLGGERGYAVCDCMLIFFYFCWRQLIAIKYSYNETWIRKKDIIFIGIMAPFGLAFLAFYATLRSKSNDSFGGVGVQMLSFFYQQGVSVDNIARAAYAKDKLPSTNISYTFGPLINWLKSTYIGHKAGFYVPTNRLENALSGNNLGSTLTYLYEPGYYSIGGGYGTQYISELWCDFGYFGILIYHIIFGYLIGKICFVTNKNWIMNAIYICLIRYIIFLPRDFALNCVGFLSATFLLPLLLVHLLAGKDRKYIKLSRVVK